MHQVSQEEKLLGIRELQAACIYVSVHTCTYETVVIGKEEAISVGAGGIEGVEGRGV